LLRHLAILIAAAGLLTACGGTSSTSAPGGGPSSFPGGTACASLAGLEGVVDHGTKAQTSSSISIAAGDNFFEPTCSTRLPAGGVTLNIKNEGSVLHNISVQSQGIDTDIDPRKRVQVIIRVGSSPVSFFCKYHVDAGMKGALQTAS
jgi:plastocyanin